MPHNDYNRAENACRIVLAVVSLASGYFAESIFDTEYGSVTYSVLAQTCTGACAVSYVVWLLSFAF